MLELPFVDEHSQEVAAPGEITWEAVLAVASGMARPDPIRQTFARAVGCRDIVPTEPPLVEGSSLVGFRVAQLAPGRRLVLEGEHRFSRYRLTFLVDEMSPDRSRVRAQTHATFPGLHGRAYRALVIGTRGHVLAVRRMLTGVRDRAERRPAPAPEQGVT